MATKVVSSILVSNGLVQGGTTVDSSADRQALIRDGGVLVFRALTTADVGGGGGGGHTITDEGAALPARATLNFTGAGVIAADDLANNRTNVTIAGGGGGHAIADEGAALAARPTLNFTGAGVTAADDSTNNRTNVTIAGGGGSSTEGIWRFDATSTTMADPLAGKIRFDSATVAGVANLAIDILTDGGVDVTNLLKGLVVDDQIYIQDKATSANWVRFRVSTLPINNAGWFQIPVTRIGSGGALPSNNSQLLIAFTQAGGGGGGGADFITAIADTATVNLSVSTGTLSADVIDGSIGDAKLRASAGLSVVGRSVNSPGQPGDLVAATDRTVLKRDGASLSFGRINLALDVDGILPVNAVPPLNAFADGEWGLTDRLAFYSNATAGNADSGVDALLAMNALAPGGRLTLTSGTAVTQADVTAATTLYYQAHVSDRLTVWDGTRWVTRTFSQLSYSAALTANKNYDVFLYDNAGASALRLDAWTSDTARAAALSLLDGRLCKADRSLYLGTIRTDAAAKFEDSLTRRFVYNAYHRAPRKLLKTQAQGSWTYSLSTPRPFFGDSTMHVDVVAGLAVEPAWLTVNIYAQESTITVARLVGVGVDSTSVLGSDVHLRSLLTGFDSSLANLIWLPAIGYHAFYALEVGGGSGTQTWYGANQSGIYGLFFA
jgi:hypothetical protein